MKATHATAANVTAEIPNRPLAPSLLQRWSEPKRLFPNL